MRASDDDRERAVLALREHLVAGRLTLDEFSERVESAYQARTGTDLVAVGSELPAVRGAPRRRRSVWATIGLFAHVVRRGRLRLARFGVVLSAFSDIDFDLREAEVGGLATTAGLLVLFGNVDIYVPEHIAVDVSGMTVFGHAGSGVGRPRARIRRSCGCPSSRSSARSTSGTSRAIYVAATATSSAHCGSSSASCRGKAMRSFGSSLAA